MNSLNCNICHEVFKSPVSITSCLHTFCSLCIRLYCRSKDGNPNCPTCLNPFQACHLKPNSLIEDIILELLENEAGKQSNDSANADVIDLEKVVDKQIDEDFIILSGTDDSNITRSSPDRIDGGDRVIECMLCNQNVKFRNINTHIDSKCKLLISQLIGVKKDDPPIINSRRLRGKQSIPKFGLDRKRKAEIDIPKFGLDRKKKAEIDYHGLKLPKLNAILSKDGLSIHGDSKTKIRRHQYWIDLYNSNLDQRDPQSDVELQAVMRNWEASTLSSAGGQSRFGGVDADEGSKYLVKHSLHFDKLVNDLQEKQREKKRKFEGEGEGDQVSIDDVATGKEIVDMSSQRIEAIIEEMVSKVSNE